jgi:hypothetical protein
LTGLFFDWALHISKHTQLIADTKSSLPKTIISLGIDDSDRGHLHFTWLWAFASLPRQKDIRLEQGRFAENRFQLGEFHIEKFAWPMTMPHGSHSTMFIGTLQNSEIIDGLSLIKARDGLYSLLWFFNNRPTPAKFKGKLLVHSSLGAFVPKAWRKQTGCYRLGGLESAEQPINDSLSNEDFEELLLVGAISETFCSLVSLEKFLKRLKTRLPPERLANLKKTAFLPVRTAPGAEDPDRYQTEFVLTLARELGADIQLLNWKKFNSVDNFKKARVLDFNDVSLCADNFLVHSALSRGARLLFDEKPQTSEICVELSPFHAAYILEELPDFNFEPPSIQEKNRVVKYFKLMEEAMPHRPANFFPWPSWFEAWCGVVRREFESSQAKKHAPTSGLNSGQKHDQKVSGDA